jgi:hypothetical protein
MRDPQRIYNYYASAEVEVTAMQPKAPFMGTELNFATNLDMWQTHNIKNFPFLVYKPDPANGSKEPSRVTPPVPSQGIIEGIKRAEEDLWRVTGIYPPSLGQQSNETSGTAIVSRQKEGDTGTFVYIDNWVRAIKHTGRVLIDMIPHVYDTPRQIRIMGEDGRVDPVNVNQPKMMIQGLSIIQKIENDLTVGEYDVVAEVGPSYATRREEAKQGMITLLQTIPQIGPLLIDLVAKAQDWPMAQQISDRAKMLLPPMIQMAEMLRAKGVPDDKISEMILQQAMQPKPDPKDQVEEEKAKHEQVKTQHDIIKTKRDEIKMQHEAASGAHEHRMSQLEAQTEQIMSSLKILKAQMDLATGQAKLQHERHKAEQKAETY